MVDVLLEKAINNFEDKSEHKCILLTELQNQLKAPKPKPRNVYTANI